MADEQYRWLDRDTAERLLRGESLDTVDATARAQAERLARALDALAAEPYAEPFPDSAELPGEAAALAAFRKETVARADARAAVHDQHRPASPTAQAHDAGQAHDDGGPAHVRGAGAASGPARGASPAAAEPAAAGSVDAGIVRSGTRPRSRPRGRTRPGARAGGGRRVRWGRPVHLVVSAALAAGAVGGVAAAATTGVLPTPFGDDPAPAASVTAPPGHPATTLSSSGAPSGGPRTTATGGASAGVSAGSPGNTARGGTGTPGHHTTPGADDDRGDGFGGRRDPLTLACHELREGKGLDPVGERAPDGAAGGSARVWTYCSGILKAIEGRARGQGGGTGRGADEGGDHTGEGAGKGRGSGRTGHGGGKGAEGGQGGDDEGHHGGGHHGGGRPRTDAAPTPPLLRPLSQRPPATPPSPAQRTGPDTGRPSNDSR